MRVLIIDPSQAFTLTLATLFGKYGVEHCVAGSGREGVSVLENQTVDLLCFAYDLQDMNGIEFLVTVKAHTLLHSQPCLMLASQQRSDIIADALKAGVTECFSKHCLDDLERFVERFIKSSQRRISGKVLLVEDSKSSAQFCRDVLERMELQVEHCRDAEQAITLWGEHHFDLVLTDYVLFGPLSGLSVIRAVRDSFGRKALTPILAISSFDDMSRKVEILRSGANDFVSKPMVAEELEARVFNLLSIQKLMRQLDLQHETMKGIAMRDPLTSLYNRNYLDGLIPELIGDAHERGEPLSLIIIDLDEFKQINDTGGHRMGDLALQQAARAIQGSCRSSDLVARIGGDEFVAVLPRVALADAITRGKGIRTRIAWMKPGGKEMTASIGIAALQPGEDYDTLFHRADIALYRAKSEGRNRVMAG